MILAVIWGGAFVAIRVADFELSFVNLTLLRWFLVSAILLALYPFLVRPKTKFERRDLPRLLVTGAFNVAIYHLALNFSEKTVSASLAGLLISLGPLFAIVFSVLLLHEKMTWRMGGALILAGVGATVISTPDLNVGFSTLFGPLGVVVSGIAAGGYTVAAKPLVGKYGPFPVVFWASFLGTALLLPLTSGSLVQQAISLSFWGWASVLYLAILSTVLANTIYYMLLGRQSIPRLSIQLYLVPFISVVGGILILGESLNAFTVVGGAILLLGVTVATRSHT